MKNIKTIKFRKAKKTFVGLVLGAAGLMGLSQESQAQRVQSKINGGIFSHNYDLYNINSDYSNHDAGIRLNSNDNGYFLWQRYNDLKFRISYGGAGASGNIDNDLFVLDYYGNLGVRGAISNMNGGNLTFSSQLYLNNGVQSKEWFRVEGNRGYYFQTYGGGFYMTDNTWIRTYGNKNFYHNTGIMRTDGSFHVGGSGSRFLVETDGDVGIGVTAPEANLDVRKNTIKFATADNKAHTWLPFTNGEVYITGNADGSGDGSIHFRTYGSNTYSEKMVIKGDGNVGIGTTTASIDLAIGDSDTGLQQQGDGKLAIYTNNTERIRIDNAGHVGIGTSSTVIDLAIGDSDTGLQQQGDGKLAIYTNNAERLRVDNAGNVGIGKTIPSEKLDVAGNIKADGVILNVGSFPDYVFEEEYKLMPLSEVEAHIEEYKRLPKMPSEKEILQKGMNAGLVNVLLVEKVEELTLHTIQQEKEIKALKTALAEVLQRMER
ncbi:shufflon system plasmid conjugative transfer pilus tip adhesin PilV [Xanthovirga aplysinae]|uniref:shufflon system plasmid conjugative transfer pilus tip adhesin PilV n=1 Tax=Xanthovirga aplysinae TaxID=2529853 RepID=UPI0012BB9D38|nr:shufflon system plasmid conjugative transfer pilus tip adhesin PilV [Xanthovirga aplysinae]MTI29636.1 shufflon system plasmid conjugative transfer pilus tip adhesin PilV [Xanthovirga aplysinae]